MNRFLPLPGFVLAWIALSISLSTSCSPEGAEQDEELLYGRWEIQRASRNGQATESLQNLFFEFYEDGNMTTNLSGSAEQAQFEWNNGRINQVGGPLEPTYNVRSLTDSSLILNTELRGYDFRFELRRQLQEE